VDETFRQIYCRVADQSAVRRCNSMMPAAWCARAPSSTARPCSAPPTASNHCEWLRHSAGLNAPHHKHEQARSQRTLHTYDLTSHQHFQFCSIRLYSSSFSRVCRVSVWFQLAGSFIEQAALGLNFGVHFFRNLG